jgi:endonuclease-3
MWVGSISKRRKRMRKITKRLEQRFSHQNKHQIRDSFALLIATILSQNTSSKNSMQAFKNLQSNHEVTVQALAKLRPEALKKAIEVAGLYNIRSKRIIEIAKEIIEKFEGRIDNVLQLSTEEARKKLTSIKGIGPKTADVFLLQKGRRAVMPVDTNIFRVSERLGLVKGRNYEDTRAILEDLIQEDDVYQMHFLLIRLGREICKPRKPLCYICPINKLCDFP